MVVEGVTVGGEVDASVDGVGGAVAAVVVGTVPVGVAVRSGRVDVAGGYGVPVSGACPATLSLVVAVVGPGAGEVAENPCLSIDQPLTRRWDPFTVAVMITL